MLSGGSCLPWVLCSVCGRDIGPNFAQFLARPPTISPSSSVPWAARPLMVAGGSSGGSVFLLAC